MLGRFWDTVQVYGKTKTTIGIGIGKVICKMSSVGSQKVSGWWQYLVYPAKSAGAENKMSWWGLKLSHWGNSRKASRFHSMDTSADEVSFFQNSALNKVCTPFLRDFDLIDLSIF